MARKSSNTNKTQHVMNLISKSTTTEEEIVQEEPTVNAFDENEIAKTVNEGLEELLKTQFESETETNEATQNIENESIDVTTSELINNNDKKEVEIKNMDNMDNLNNLEKFSDGNKAESIVDVKSDNSQESKKTYHKDQFEVHNMLENICLELMDDIILKFDVCKCEKCKKDILAFTLNALPPKYVVTHQGELYAKLNSHGQQNSTDIITAIMKACVKVKTNPRHN